MADAISDKLRLMLERYPDATDNVERLEALLYDWAPGQRREISLVVAAASEGVPAALRDGAGAGSIDQRVSQLARQLEDDRGLAPDAARFAVESWASALRLSHGPVRPLDSSGGAPPHGGGGGGGGAHPQPLIDDAAAKALAKMKELGSRVDLRPVGRAFRIVLVGVGFAAHLVILVGREVVKRVGGSRGR